MKYRICGVLLIFTTLAACSYVSFTDQFSQDERVTPLPVLATITKTNLEKQEFLMSPEPSRVPETGQKSLTQTITNTTCWGIAPGDPYIDLTVPDGTIFLPGENFSKTWRLVNSGSCNWDNNFKVIWFSGADLGEIHSQSLDAVVEPGQSIDITVEMVAPQEPGIYQSNWKIETSSGEMFGIGPSAGSPFWVKIEVLELSSPTPEPTPTSTPTPVVMITGDAKLFPGDVFNLDNGAPGSPGEDISVGLDLNAGFLLTPMNGARVGLFGNTLPVLSDCTAMSLEKDPLILDSVANTYYCVRTNQGLPGFIYIDSIDLEQNTLQINYLTWSIP